MFISRYVGTLLVIRTTPCHDQWQTPIADIPTKYTVHNNVKRVNVINPGWFFDRVFPGQFVHLSMAPQQFPPAGGR